MLKYLFSILFFIPLFAFGQNTVVDVIVNSDDHNTLEAAVLAAGLETTLSGPGPFTVFAPTDAAFAAVGQETLDRLLANPGGALSNILKYHVVGAEAMSGDLSDGQMITSVYGDDVTVSIMNGNVMINNALVTVADIPTDNGVVHVIDAVLLPSSNFNMIMDIVTISDQHNTLEAALVASELNAVMNSEGTFTLFAPTDAAFDALPDGTVDELLMDPTGDLAEILKYHVLGQAVMDASLMDGMTVTTVQGKDITVTINADGVFINDAKVTATNIAARNGIVHVLDAVLIPPRVTVVDIIVNSTEHDTLEAAVLAAGLAGTLSGDGPFTVFAPTDAAFAALPPGTVETLLQEPQGLLTQILLYHTVGATALSGDLNDGQRVTTLNGRDVFVTINADGVFINNAQVTMADVETDNGVVHVIDAVLIPGNSIFDIVAGSADHTTLETAIRTVGLENALTVVDDLTLFAPNDAAFDKLPAGTVDFLIQNPDVLIDILGLHLLEEALTTDDFTDPDEQLFFAANGSVLTIFNDGTQTTVNEIPVTAPNVQATNGIIHGIETVILNPDSTIVDVVDNSPDHTVLEVAIDSLGLEVDRLLRSKGPFTLFAPVDGAFADIPAADLQALLDDEDALGDVIGNHLIFGEVLAGSLSDGLVVESASGTLLRVVINADGTFINGAKVIATDILTDNGVVHVMENIIPIEENTVYTIVSNSPDHTTLKAAIDAAGLDQTLSDDDVDLTLFAPTDAAFDALPDGTVDALLMDPTGELTQILLYHTVDGIAFAGDLNDGQKIVTLNGKEVTVTINTDGVFINDAMVTVTDLEADNGVVHVIDAVLLPPKSTVLDIIVNSPDHETLEAAVRAAELVETLNGEGPFTVFAPTDEAFAALPDGTLDALLADPMGQLTSVLLYHVVGSKALSSDLSDGQEIETVNGQKVTVTINADGVFINNAQVTVENLEADNGVVHVINAVLTPSVGTDDRDQVEASIYPNPVRNMLNYNVSTSTDKPVNVSIIDVNGKILQRIMNTTTNNSIRLEQYPAGSYILQLSNEDILAKQRFVRM